MNKPSFRVSILGVAIVVPLFLVALMMGLSAGEIVGRPGVTREDALHWGVFPRGFYPQRDYELQVKRFIDGEVVNVCVSYRCFHSHERGDFYLGQY